MESHREVLDLWGIGEEYVNFGGKSKICTAFVPQTGNVGHADYNNN